ncbi:hypothetical protein EVAR_93950_1 [Eumeta japonica]|uniref:Uncharacterized protein n=1 Tax=Eumeta variegata TaxID=151549 RepID=A0A4C1TP74_EUMVA|nr:hypothetical protein EVAR_93950_1 [Eumeta japonica]
MKREILKYVEKGRPGLRLRPVAFFIDCNSEQLGICFGSKTRPHSISISLGLAVLLNGSTFEISMKRNTFDAYLLLSTLGDAGSGKAISSRTISVDAILVSFETGEVVDRLECIKEVYDIVVYEDREQVRWRDNEKVEIANGLLSPTNENEKDEVDLPAPVSVKQVRNHYMNANAFLDFIALTSATLKVHNATCEQILGLYLDKSEARLTAAL